MSGARNQESVAVNTKATTPFIDHLTEIEKLIADINDLTLRINESKHTNFYLNEVYVEELKETHGAAIARQNKGLANGYRLLWDLALKKLVTLLEKAKSESDKLTYATHLLLKIEAIKEANIMLKALPGIESFQYPLKESDKKTIHEITDETILQLENKIEQMLEPEAKTKEIDAQVNQEIAKLNFNGKKLKQLADQWAHGTKEEKQAYFSLSIFAVLQLREALTGPLVTDNPQLFDENARSFCAAIFEIIANDKKLDFLVAFIKQQLEAVIQLINEPEIQNKLQAQLAIKLFEAQRQLLNNLKTKINDTLSAADIAKIEALLIASNTYMQKFKTIDLIKDHPIITENETDIDLYLQQLKTLPNCYSMLEKKLAKKEVDILEKRPEDTRKASPKNIAIIDVHSGALMNDELIEKLKGHDQVVLIDQIASPHSKLEQIKKIKQLLKQNGCEVSDYIDKGGIVSCYETVATQCARQNNGVKLSIFEGNALHFELIKSSQKLTAVTKHLIQPISHQGLRTELQSYAEKLPKPNNVFSLFAKWFGETDRGLERSAIKKLLSFTNGRTETFKFDEVRAFRKNEQLTNLVNKYIGILPTSFQDIWHTTPLVLSRISNKR